MQVFLICFPGFLCFVLLIYIIVYRSNINKITRVLEEIRTGNTYRKINLRAAGKAVGRLGAELNSLTDRFNETIIRKEQLEDSQKKLVANMSHDLRTPLTSILGYIEVLKEDGSLTPEERMKYLDIVEAKGKALYKLVEDFFEMSGLEAEDLSLKLVKVDICAILKEAVVEFYQDFIDAGIEPDIDIPDYPIHVSGDEAALRRIIQNLLSNAIKYGQEGKAAGIGLRCEADRIWVDVWDRGRGIEQEDMPHIFERLYTADSSRNDRLRGTGLGLAIVRKLVSLMNGEVKASSIPWERTVFSFCLPKY